MQRTRSLTGLVLTSWVLWFATSDADMKVKTDHDPAFDFTKARTWAWNAKEPGSSDYSANSERQSGGDQVARRAHHHGGGVGRNDPPQSSRACDQRRAGSDDGVLTAADTGLTVPADGTIRSVNAGVGNRDRSAVRRSHCAGLNRARCCSTSRPTEASCGGASPRRKSSRERRRTSARS